MVGVPIPTAHHAGPGTARVAAAARALLGLGSVVGQRFLQVSLEALRRHKVALEIEREQRGVGGQGLNQRCPAPLPDLVVKEREVEEAGVGRQTPSQRGGSHVAHVVVAEVKRGEARASARCGFLLWR